MLVSGLRALALDACFIPHPRPWPHRSALTRVRRRVGSPAGNACTRVHESPAHTPDCSLGAVLVLRRCGQHGGTAVAVGPGRLREFGPASGPT